MVLTPLNPPSAHLPWTHAGHVYIQLCVPIPSIFFKGRAPQVIVSISQASSSESICPTHDDPPAQPSSPTQFFPGYLQVLIDLPPLVKPEETGRKSIQGGPGRFALRNLGWGPRESVSIWAVLTVLALGVSTRELRSSASVWQRQQERTLASPWSCLLPRLCSLPVLGL